MSAAGIFYTVSVRRRISGSSQHPAANQPPVGEWHLGFLQKSTTANMRKANNQNRSIRILHYIKRGEAARRCSSPKTSLLAAATMACARIGRSALLHHRARRRRAAQPVRAFQTRSLAEGAPVVLGSLLSH